jgi:[ribosomal protein S5]-alanine N-acetyltransferase
MQIKINDEFYISETGPEDKPAYVEHLTEKQISEQTLNIPYPYSDEDADWWINHNMAETARLGRPINWVIRRRDGYLIGGIGFAAFEPGKTHKAEIGYWLAKPYWGQGIMSLAIKAITQHAFRELGLKRITAHVFNFNKGSARALEKAGYTLEGRLRQHYSKNGKIFDGLLYAIVADDLKS